MDLVERCRYRKVPDWRPHRFRFVEFLSRFVFGEWLQSLSLKDRAKDFDIPKTLKMKASYEQIRIWKKNLSSYIRRIQNVKSHIDTTSEPASSYLSLVQAERRKERLKKTSNRRYKIYHKKKLAQLENSWNNRTTLS